MDEWDGLSGEGGEDGGDVCRGGGRGGEGFEEGVDGVEERGGGSGGHCEVLFYWGFCR